VDSFRTFIAIELPPDVRSRVTQHIARLRREQPEVRASWCRENNLHLTLKFLGDVPVPDIPKVSDAVERATKNISSFPLTFSGCGVFPPHGRPSVLWIGTASDVGSGRSPANPAPANLDRLFNAIEKELVEVGFRTESRPFHPHLTVARLRQAEGARPLAELHKNLGFSPIGFDVSEVVVFRSELLREGSLHTAISRHKCPGESAHAQ
jgi:2'-5' RNA ligase